MYKCMYGFNLTLSCKVDLNFKTQKIKLETGKI